MISERGIWQSSDETNTHEYDASLAEKLVFLFAPCESIVDIGCGNGKYVMNFLAHGISCKGYDGSPLTPELSGGLCETMDFSQPVDIGKFDMVLSLEVGEHIPVQYEQIFIDNLCNASKYLILMSWAVEGQPGIGHVNCRSNEYIIAEVEKRGFKYTPKTSELLRKISSLPWFKNTLMFFVK